MKNVEKQEDAMLQSANVLPKVSIIIPVYNASIYLRECLDSLIHQSLKEIEIIVVNDASPDPQDDIICSEYASKDDRVIYILHEKNLKQAGARNTGIKRASADYIGFTDCDDWVELDMFEQMYEKAIKYDCDLVECGVLNEPKKDQTHCHYKKAELIETENGIEFWRYFSNTEVKLTNTCWNKLHKRSLFIENDIYFPTDLRQEDLATTARILYFSRRIYVLPNTFYHWRRRGDSSMSSTDGLGDFRRYIEFIKNFLKEQGGYEQYQERFLKMALSELSCRWHWELDLSENARQEFIQGNLEYLHKSDYVWEYIQFLDPKLLDSILDLSRIVLEMLDEDPPLLSILGNPKVLLMLKQFSRLQKMKNRTKTWVKKQLRR